VKRRLKNLAQLTTSCEDSNTRPFVALEHIESTTGKLKHGIDLPDYNEPSTGVASAESGDVLFGKLRPYLAKILFVDKSLYASTELMCLRPVDGVVPLWFYYLLASKPIVEWAVATSDGAKMPRTSWERLSQYRIEVPPESRQQRIADRLTAETAHIDELIAKKLQLIILLGERFIQQAHTEVTGHMVFTDPFNVIPKEIVDPEWMPVKLGSDLSFGSGTTPPAGDEQYYGNGVPWIVTGNLRDQPIEHVERSVTREALSTFSALQIHPSGALLVAMYGATVGRLGLTTFPAAVNQACCVMHSGARIDTMFLFYYLLSHRSVLVDRSIGAGQPNISQEILKSLRIPVPDRHTQEAIVNRLTARRRHTDRLISLIREQLSLLGERRQALTTATVTGELDIPGATA
jgi:type I restriction enzyme S subunit